jgi:hypothetical protein
MFAVLYNGLSGYADTMRTNGAGSTFNSPLWLAEDSNVYLKLASLNNSADTLELSVEEIQDMLCVYNAQADVSTIQAQLDGATAEAVLVARGLS